MGQGPVLPANNLANRFLENRTLPQQGACGFVLNISFVASMKLSNRAASARVGLCDPRPPLHCELSDVNFESYG